MSAESENFDSLRKLLTLKRHEQPPSGYFEQLSSEIMARLRTGEHRKSDLWQQVGDEASWLQRLWGMLAAKPAMAGVFGMVVCGVVLTGIYYAQKPSPATVSLASPASPWKTSPDATGPLALSQPSAVTSDGSSTNPVLNTASPSLFDKFGAPNQPTPVNFQAGDK